MNRKLPIDAWTLTHAVLGWLAGKSEFHWYGALAGAAAVEALQLVLADRWPKTFGERPGNVLADVMVYMTAYSFAHPKESKLF